MDLEISGRTAIVTGAARGIGAAIAQRLVAEGANVVIADLKGAAEQAEALVKIGGKAVAAETDVTDAASVDGMVATATATFGGVDILVNNAGFTRDMRIGKMQESDWDAVVDVILKGAFLCTKAA